MSAILFSELEMTFIYWNIKEAVKRDLKLLTRDREKIVAELQRLQVMIIILIMILMMMNDDSDNDDDKWQW